MEYVYAAWDWVVRQYYINTELALWVTIGLFGTILFLIMLSSPAFRRFMTVVIVVALIIGALLIKFGPQVSEELGDQGALITAVKLA